MFSGVDPAQPVRHALKLPLVVPPVRARTSIQGDNRSFPLGPYWFFPN